MNHKSSHPQPVMESFLNKVEAWKQLYFLTHFIPLSLSIPLKTSENLWFSDVFGKYRKRTVI